MWYTSGHRQASVISAMFSQDCRDQCQQKSRYYYHCGSYKSCWDTCKDDIDCRDQCSYKGCDYGLFDTLKELVDAVSAAALYWSADLCNSMCMPCKSKDCQANGDSCSDACSPKHCARQRPSVAMPGCQIIGSAIHTVVAAGRSCRCACLVSHCTSLGTSCV